MGWELRNLQGLVEEKLGAGAGKSLQLQASVSAVSGLNEHVLPLLLRAASQAGQERGYCGIQMMLLGELPSRPGALWE